MKNIKQKILSVLLIVLTIPCIILEHDATATIFVSFFAIPAFFAKESWLC